MNLISSENVPEAWKLDSSNKPINQEPLIKFVEFIKNNEGWIVANPELAKKYCSLLDRTVKTDTSEEVKNLQQILFRKNPDLFPPSRLIKIGGLERRISLEKLEKSSEKFSVLFQSSFGDAKSDIIKLSPPENTDREVINAFLDYLENGTVNLDGIEVVHLVNLAHEHSLTSLINECVAAISSEINVENVLYLLEYSVSRKINDLAWVCFIFAFENLNNREFLEILGKADISDEVTKILTLTSGCSEYAVIPTFLEGGDRMVKLWGKKNGTLDFLKKLNDTMSINALKIETSTHNQQELENLAESIPNLNSLIIQNEIVTTIPMTWTANVKTLECHGCCSLTTLEAPMATWLDCSSCYELTSLDAPMATELDCSYSAMLKTLYAPMTTKLYFRCYKAPTQITVKRGCVIYSMPEEGCNIEYCD